MSKRGAAAAADGAGRKSARVEDQPAKGLHSIGGLFNMQRVDREGVLCIVPTVRTPVSSIISFDMDDTLIATKSGKVFATGRSDWRWWHHTIPTLLKELHNSGKGVVIFSNQAGIAGKGHDESKASMIVGKIVDMITELNFPIYAFLATGEDEHRKPSLGMWKVCEEFIGGTLNKSECMYIGDAAGRAVNWKPGRKKDFSCSDRKFAYNLGIPFATPEEYFLKEKAVAFGWDGLGPDDLTAMLASAVAALPAHCHPSPSKPEMVLLVGWPASGKSSFAKRHYVSAGYEWVNRDTLKTPAKCQAAAKAALASGKSVIIDNTNPQAASRAEYIAIAKAAGAPVRCLWLESSQEFSKHMNMFRERMGISDHVPRIAYATYNKNFEEPKVTEGFVSVNRVPFVPTFDSPAMEAAFRLLC